MIAVINHRPSTRLLCEGYIAERTVVREGGLPLKQSPPEYLDHIEKVLDVHRADRQILGDRRLGEQPASTPPQEASAPMNSTDRPHWKVDV